MGASMAEVPTEPRSDEGFETGRLFASVQAELFGEPAPELTLGRYRIIDVLGSGGMGVVYRAYEPALDRVVALKIIRPRLGTEKNELYLARFVREGRVMARLGHPHIVTVYEAGTEDGVGYLAMEYLEGGTLERWLHDNPVGSTERVETLLDYAVAAARGLAAAHAEGIVHRDIKPENMLLDGAGRLKLADFGVARAGDARLGPEVAARKRSALQTRDDATITQTDEMVGTIRYAAPEQHVGEASTRSDQFSFCLTFAELALGRYPFETALPLGLEPGESLSLGDVPRWFVAILERGLASKPSRRFESMDEVLDAIARGRTPSRRGSALVLSVAGTVALAGLVWPREDSQPCTDDGRVSWWTPDRADRVRAAFVAADASVGSARAETVIESADAYVAEWTRVRAAVCRARQEGKGAMLDETEACLSRREAQVGALLQQLEAGGLEAVQHAPEAMRSVPTVASCEDTSRLLALRFDPPAPDAQDEVAALQRMLDEAAALRDLGSIIDARAKADDAVKVAEGLGYGPALAEALAELAEVLYAQGEVEAARTAARRALVEARAVQHPAVAAKVAAVMIWADGGDVDRVEFWSSLAAGEAAFVAVPAFDRQIESLSAQKFAQLGHLDRALALHESLLASATSEDSLAVSSTNASSVYMQKGDYVRGGDLAGQAAEIFGRLYGESHPSAVTARFNVGHALWGQGDLAGAASAFADVVAARESFAGADAETTRSARYSLAQVLAAQGKHDAALSAMRRVLEAIPKKTLDHAMTRLELAGIEAAAGEHARAIEDTHAGLAELRGTTDSQVLLAQALLGAAEILAACGETEPALALLSEARALADAVEPGHPWHAELERVESSF